MATHLVTGYAGKAHIKSEDQRSFNASFFGTGQFVMEEAGNKIAASIIDNNTVRILDGDILMKGAHIRIEPNTYEDMIIENGTTGMNRCDLIVMEYSKDQDTGIESATMRVLKGTASSGTAAIPGYTDGDILGGADFNQMPLYKVKLEGVVLTEIECLFETIPTYATLAQKCHQEFVKMCDAYLRTLGILNTLEEIEANTQENKIAGALALRELADELSNHDHNGKYVHAHALEFDGTDEHGGFIDFHYGKAANDYTTRVIECGAGQLFMLMNGNDNNNSVRYRIFTEYLKPSGTYTGNGGSNTINIGPAECGMVIAVKCKTSSTTGYFCLVSSVGAIGIKEDGTIVNLSNGQCSFYNGVLTLATSKDMLNESGLTYEYQVL